MIIDAIWSKPLFLADGAKRNLIYYFSLNSVPEVPGCYIFYKKHGKSFSILYIGKTGNLKKRLGQQQNNTKLMMGIKNGLSGRKNLVYCTIQLKQGQKQDKVLNLVEKNLIKIALSQGNELLNKQGAKNKYDHIKFSGNRHSEKLFGRMMSIVK